MIFGGNMVSRRLECQFCVVAAYASSFKPGRRGVWNRTGIPVSLWILRKGKTEQTRDKILFIDARELGHMLDRKVRELEEEVGTFRMLAAIHRYLFEPIYDFLNKRSEPCKR